MAIKRTNGRTDGQKDSLFYMPRITPTSGVSSLASPQVAPTKNIPLRCTLLDSWLNSRERIICQTQLWSIEKSPPKAVSAGTGPSAARKCLILDFYVSMHMMRWKFDHQFENCQKLFEDKIPHWSTKNVAKKRSVANEPGDRWFSIHVIK